MRPTATCVKAALMFRSLLRPAMNNHEDDAMHQHAAELRGHTNTTTRGKGHFRACSPRAEPTYIDSHTGTPALHRSAGAISNSRLGTCNR